MIHNYLKTILMCGTLLISITNADVIVGAGETYTLQFNEFPYILASASPGYTPYNDFSFTLGFNSADLFDDGIDDIRIRLYEDPLDITPVYTLFEPFVLMPNLTKLPQRVSISSVSGSLWYDYTGKIEVEVLSGSVQVDYINIDLNPGSSSLYTSFDAIPEPNTFALLIIGSGALYRYRKSRTRAWNLQ